MEITSNTAAWQPSTDPKVSGQNTASQAGHVKVERRPAPPARAITQPGTSVTSSR